MPAASATDDSTSVYRLSKGDDVVSIFIESTSGGKITSLRTGDREYDSDSL